MSEKKEVKSYKVSPEFKGKLELLFSESGLETQEEFLAHVASLYELHKLKEGGASGYKKQLEELEYHSRRNVDLFLSMIETETSGRYELNQTHEEILSDRTVLIVSQEQELATIKREFKQKEDELIRMKEENKNQATQLEQHAEISRKDNLLVDEYKQRLDTLSGLVNQYKPAADENNELRGTLDDNAKKINSLSERIEKLLQEAVQNEERYKENIERIADRKELEKERELLKLRVELQEKVQHLQNESTAKIQANFDRVEQIRSEYEQQIELLKKNNDG